MNSGDCNNNSSSGTSNQSNNVDKDSTTPICRCRVIYLGSAVPHFTKDGLQGIQEPLRQLYPDHASLVSGQAGIDSWLSVWSNGILLENIDESGREVKRFFQIDSLHYCAAVRYVVMMGTSQASQSSPGSTYDRTPPIYHGTNGAQDSAEENTDIYQSLTGNHHTHDGRKKSTNYNYDTNSMAKFLPLDSPYSKNADPSHPPVFACILRRTIGIKVLECHAFICKREAPANALVRCCFHAYADTMYAKQIGADLTALSSSSANNEIKAREHDRRSLASSIKSRSKSTTDLESHNNDGSNRTQKSRRLRSSNNHDANDSGHAERVNNFNLNNADELYRSHQPHDGDYCDQRHLQDQSVRSSRRNMPNSSRLAPKLSKSMHHLDCVERVGLDDHDRHSDCYQQQRGSCANIQGAPKQWSQTSRHSHIIGAPPPQLEGRMLPPHQSVQNLLPHSRGNTLKSIRSLAANSIASTLLRGKLHAKAMSTAGSHVGQPMFANGAQPPLGMPIVMGPNGPIRLVAPYKGSQTMRAPSKKSKPSIIHPDFTTLDAKQMKKLVKKSAKLGLDPNAFVQQLSGQMPPPQPPPIPFHMMAGSIPYAQDMRYGAPPLPGSISDIGVVPGPNNGYPHSLPPFLPNDFPKGGPMPTLVPVQPSVEFLKSKAGKKWLKQQKELKKCLPPHLEGMPIVFGVPPPGMELVGPPIHPGAPIEPIFMDTPDGSSMIRSNMQQQHIPPMDDSGYYNNPHPYYGIPNGADGPSAATTLVRCSPVTAAAVGNANGNYFVDEAGNIISGDQLSMSHAGGSVRRLQPMENGHDGGFGVEHYNDHNGASYDNSMHYQRANQLQHPPRHRILPGPPTSGHRDPHYHPNELQGREQELMNGNKTPRSHHKSSRSNSSGPNGSRRSSTQTGADDEIYNNANENNHNDNGAQLSSPDDTNSYHSGIYKKGHMNERAFSYSIRQESSRNQQPYDVPHAMPIDELSRKLQHQMNIQASRSKSKSRERV